MKVIPAFFKLIRWPNLVFIALTQILYRFFVIRFVYANYSYGIEKMKLATPLFYWLVLASVCIAAAGYIINDYFDVNIDLINKPGRLIIGRYVKRRWAIFFHIFLSLSGFLLSCYVGYRIKNKYIPLFNFVAIAALWFYSTTFKKKLLIGNILISLLTAWVIMVITFAEYRFQLVPGNQLWKGLLKFSFAYAGFAFIISLIREVIKDMEDMPGDAQHNCKTMPILWGLQVTKVFIAVWLIVCIAVIAGILIYVIQLGWWLACLYSLLFILIPLAWILRKLYDANTPVDFHKLSNAVKLVMLAGILSMIFF